MAAGIPDELFWRLTPTEVAAVLKERAEEERRQSLLFGLVAATIVNVNQRKGAALVHPEDFFTSRAQQQMSPEAAHAFMDTWAASVNDSQGVKAS